MTDQVRAALDALLEMPSACTTDAEVIENNKRRKAARAALALEHVAGEATGMVSVELLQTERATADRLREENAKLRTEIAAEFQQQRGRHFDIIKEAIANYDEWMLDDDYEASAKLHEIIRRMRERLEFSAVPTPALDLVTVEAAAEFRFWMDARRFASSRSKLTGAEIKTIANTQPMYPVYRDTGPHFSSHVAVGDGELVDIDGEHFYALIPATYYRGGLL